MLDEKLCLLVTIKGNVRGANGAKKPTKIFCCGKGLENWAGCYTWEARGESRVWARHVYAENVADPGCVGQRIQAQCPRKKPLRATVDMLQKEAAVIVAFKISELIENDASIAEVLKKGCRFLNDFRLGLGLLVPEGRSNLCLCRTVALIPAGSSSVLRLSSLPRVLGLEVRSFAAVVVARASRSILGSCVFLVLLLCVSKIS